MITPAHFLTDVVAGSLTGGLLAMCAWIIVVRLARHPPRADESPAERLRDVVVSREADLPQRMPEDARL